MPRKRIVETPKVILWSPQSFDPIDLLPPTFRRYADHARFIVSSIIRQQDHLKNLPDPQAAYVPLNSSLLRYYIPHPKAGQIVALLLELGVIETDGSYIPGVRSKGYRLTQEHRGKPQAYLCGDPRLARKIRDRRDTTWLPIHRHLKANLERLRIDSEEAGRILEGMGLGRPKGSLGTSAHRLEAYSRSLAEIEIGDWRLGVDGFGRNHSNLTNLPKALRETLRVDGEEISFIDIRNSQPLILSLVLRDEETEGGTNYRSSPKGGLKTHKTLPCRISDSTITHDSRSQPEQTLARDTERPYPNVDGFVPKAPSGSLTPPQVDEALYRRLCEEGRLYDFLISRLPKAMPRETFKRRFFAGVLFGRIDQKPTQVSRVFGQTFPTVLSKIHAMKGENYRHLSHRLQRRESGLVVETIAARFAREKPQAFIGTVHDCIAVKRSDRGKAEQIILEEFGRLGVVPTLHQG